ncbi:MAG: NAD-dependent epimerase [Bacteroidales bacterium]|nr:NAD-dependent epimerase [Bacteroidales bacterium]MDT8431710.1 NAD-dependent epimerase [Bacteroidales bacterium]
MKKVLITGTAGFIGSHLAAKLLSDGYEVVGLDMVNDYYDVNLKYARLERAGIAKESVSYGSMVQSSASPAYRFIQLKLEDKEQVMNLFEAEQFKVVINLAAQAGVRYSLTNPEAYIDSNITGFLNILEACRHHPVENLIYASSSSVYGLNANMPFSVRSNVDHPVSLYAASKKSNELMAHTYSHLFGIPTIGLRFFTVYGPWGRPDMALFLFTDAILRDRPIEVFNHGKMERDFTYIDDIVNGMAKMVDRPPRGDSNWDPVHPDPSKSTAPYRLYNIGNNSPVRLMDFIEAIEQALGKEAIKEMKPIQPGDVVKTWADVDALAEDYDYRPGTSIRFGVNNFIAWFREYYGI